MPAAPEPTLPVITGLGVVSSIGSNVERFWEAVQAGVASARPVRTFATENLRNHFACEIDDTTIQGFASLPRGSRLAAIAATEALADAAVRPAEVAGLCVGTTMGDLPEVERQLGEPGTSPDSGRLPSAVGGNFGDRIASALGITSGPVMTLATSCSAGNLAIFRAADLIRGGHLPRLLAGGADAFSQLAFLGFSRLRAMAPERCTPFSRDRKGMLLGEGAAFFVLEAYAAARARGARIYGAVAGYGLSCDAYHVATPDPSGRGAALAMQQALAASGVTPDRVDYVCAHGTGTPANDLAESRACQSVFGRRLPPISSIKALIGHALGGASAIEAVASALSLSRQQLVPAWHADSPDPDCDIPLAPAGTAGRRPVHFVLSNAFAFGGNNSCLALRRLEPPVA